MTGQTSFKVRGILKVIKSQRNKQVGRVIVLMPYLRDFSIQSSFSFSLLIYIVILLSWNTQKNKNTVSLILRGFNWCF